MIDLLGILNALMLIEETVSLNSQVYGGSFSLKTYAMEGDFYKQMKLAKNIDKTN